jgi:hypothetical protein
MDAGPLVYPGRETGGRTVPPDARPEDIDGSRRPRARRASLVACSVYRPAGDHGRGETDMADQPSTVDSTQQPPNSSTAPANSEPPDWYKNPPEWLKNLQQPAQQPPAQTQQPSTQSSGPGAQLLDAINSLPEKIIAGLKETSPAAQTAQQTAQTNAPAASTQEPGKKTFAERWFSG